MAKTERISDERLQAKLKSTIAARDAYLMGSFSQEVFAEEVVLLEELIALRAANIAVTDEMVKRALGSIEGEPDLFITEGAMRWALEAALEAALK